MSAFLWMTYRRVPSLNELFTKKSRQLTQGVSGAVCLMGAAIPDMDPAIFNVPEQLTLLRLGFLPLFLILIIYDRYAGL